MKNYQQCEQGLRYENFSILFIQTFTSSRICIPQNDLICRVEKGNIDDQLFTHREKIIDRYQLKGFDIKIITEAPRQITLEGHVHVWAAVFFDTTVQISYRLVVPPGDTPHETGFCRISHPLSTDELIVIAGIIQHVEHWIYNPQKERQEIDGSLKTIEIKNFHLDENSQPHQTDVPEPNLTFEEIQKRYRNFFDKTGPTEFRYDDHNYIFIDVWENISHSGTTDFSSMQEDDIIQHIETHHKAELIGLMTLYPEEWPYRMESSFEAICGRNIAIDTDDLVLANENIAVVFGTYGKRGEEAPTDWIQHLERRDRYHVSWPEYLVLVEILLAKKHILNYVLNKYIYNSRKAISENIRDMIEQNARLSVKLSNIVLQLNSVRYLRYMAHKYMYQETTRNLKIEEDERQLNETIKRVDKSLNNTNTVMEIKQANDTKYILLFISVASLFGVLLQGNEVPVFSRWSREFGETTALILVIITSIGIAGGMLVMVKMTVKYFLKKRIRKNSHL